MKSFIKSNTALSVSSDIHTPQVGLERLGYALFLNPLLVVWISLEILRAQFDIIITSHTFFIILSDKIGLNFVVIWHRMWQSRSRAFCETKKKQSLRCLLSYKVYTKINKSSSSSRSFPFPVVGLWLKPIILLTVFFFFLIRYLLFCTNWLQSSPWKLFYLYIWKKQNTKWNHLGTIKMQIK